MCGRFTITATLDELLERYGVHDDTSIPTYRPNYNVAPTQMLPVVINDGNNNCLELMKWGLIPSWANDPKIAFKTINARAETVAEKPAFRTSIRRKRCIIPACSFYEWRKVGANKQPMRITLKSEEIFSMAGVYDSWTDQEGKQVNSFSILTSEPNELMMDIHDRMPVILKPEHEALWLDRGANEPEMIRHLMVPFLSDQMKAYPVSTRVGNVRNNDPDLIKEAL
ncbi:SOS response-associated peptidase [Paenibacillus alginolyticus]|uniref:SOS response-associated peptidase n=1 Tax=Paenibacillus alginolyticus TaxID=59839 RepID=UPI0003FBF8AD|nr:SOS response-associated peptidase [Paenibacillus alginolyticus]MCY9666457.1 SOS response-associated peptidase [Paenibacillus alginolyticus]